MLYPLEICCKRWYNIFIYPNADSLGAMKTCELCGAEIPENLKVCSRCGFEFQKEIRRDSRDRALLERNAGASVEEVRRDLRDRQAKLTAYMENLAAKSLAAEELSSLMDESLTYLQIPLVLGVEDELRLDGGEKEFVGLVTRCLGNADSLNGGPVGTAGTYIKLSNALQSLGETETAMLMIDKALLINPRDRAAQFGKAKLLFYAKRYDAAKKCLEKLIAAGDDDNARYLSELIEQLIGY